MTIARLFLLILACAVVPAVAFAAAGDIAVRLKDHEDRVRLVLDWGNGVAPAHTIKSIDDRTVEVAFAAPGHLAPFLSLPLMPEITDIRAVSAEGTNLRVWVMTSAPLFDRDLSVGSRLMLDFRKDVATRMKAQKAAAAAPPPSAPVPAASAPLPSAVPPQKTDKAQAPAAPVLTPPAEKLIPALAIDPKDPPVITISSLAPFGAAAYVYHDRLWLVVDQPNFTAGPQITGKGAGQIPPFERLTLPDATVYYTRLPSSILPMHGEGGDVMWRIVLAEQKPALRALEPQRITTPSPAKIMWPATGAAKVIAFEDPISGERALITTVKKSTDFTGFARRFADFYVPRTLFGVVALPRVDDLSMTIGAGGVALTRASGLSTTTAEAAQTVARVLPPPPGEKETSAAKDATPAKTENAESTAPTESLAAPFYRFDRWAMGGVPSMIENEVKLAGDLGARPAEDRAGGLMNIGKMYLANNRGSEALGYFSLASEIQPGLLDTPDFLGLRGAARAVNGQFDLAYEDLRNPGLDVYPDVGAWRAYVLANLQDWQQAAEKVKRDVAFVKQYPREMAGPMVLTFAEILLRAGKVTDAQKILSDLNPAAGTPQKKAKAPAVTGIMASIRSQHEYLLGEAARQAGKKDEAKKYWDKLAKSNDDKYRARARLAMTIMDYEQGKIKATDAIDQLEGLRYAWRGDEVEAAVNARLGEIYLDRGDYLRGLNVLRDAASLVPETQLGRRITATMSDKFRSLFLGEGMKKINPLDAITVYEKFSELMPVGDDANKLTFSLIDRLMEVDLLDRAAAVLQKMIDTQLTGDQKLDAELRLAGIQLLNDQPQTALKILNQVGQRMIAVSDPSTMAARIREMKILKARALYQDRQVDAALNILKDAGTDLPYLRTRADIAWRSGRWHEAADSLSSILAQTPPKAGAKLSTEQAEMIRNLAVAVNLSGDRGALAQIRAQYEGVMIGADQYQTFDVVTRTRQAPTLADRDTLNRLVAEVDLFGGFLDAYRKTSQEMLKASSTQARAPVAAAPIPPPAAGDIIGNKTVSGE